MESNRPDQSTFDRRNAAELQAADLAIIERQLGRPPVGLQEVMRRNPAGLPAVLRVKSLVDGVPFPTLFWLCDERLSQLLYGLESDGTMQRVQAEVDDSAVLREQLVFDNQEHVKLRASFFTDEVRRGLEELGVGVSFAKKGIGGNANFSRVRCLHAYVAAHLIQPNAIGRLLEVNLGQDSEYARLTSELR